MLGTCNESCSKMGCGVHLIIKILVIVGGVNWGLVGLGMLLGKAMTSWNLVNLFVGSMPMVEAIVYLLVGIAAVLMICGCKCKKCTVTENAPATPNIENPENTQNTQNTQDTQSI